MSEQLKWRPSEVDPQKVRDALQNIQLGGEFDSLGRVLVTRDVVAASRYAIEKLKTESNDLLEALKNAVSYAENMDYDFDHAFWGEIRGAIAKAEENQ